MRIWIEMSDIPSEIGAMRNLGKASERWLASIGVRTADELRAMGAVNAFRLLSLRGYRPSLNLVWAIEGALRGVHWTALPPEVKDALRREIESPWDPSEVLDVE